MNTPQKPTALCATKTIELCQFEILRTQVRHLETASTLLNILHTRTDLNSIDPCEMEAALKGIEDLLNICLEQIESRIDFMLNKGVVYA